MRRSQLRMSEENRVVFNLRPLWDTIVKEKCVWSRSAVPWLRGDTSSYTKKSVSFQSSPLKVKLVSGSGGPPPTHSQSSVMTDFLSDLAAAVEEMEEAKKPRRVVRVKRRK